MENDCGSGTAHHLFWDDREIKPQAQQETPDDDF